jgi:hypothetical protein
MKRNLLLFCAVLLGSLHCIAQNNSVAGEWRGVWTNPTGFVFTAEMTLQAGSSCGSCAASGDGSIQGQILWTLKKVGANSSPDYARKVDMTGTEFVKGEMRGSGLLVLNGYDKNDPNNVIGLDNYRLALADNGQVIGGITLSHGSWMGQFILKKIRP